MSTMSTTTSTTSTTTTTTTREMRRDAFDRLLDKLGETRFAPVPQVRIEDARQFRRLYTVAQHVMAGVPNSMEALLRVLNGTSMLPTGFALIGIDTLTAPKNEGGIEDDINDVLDFRNSLVEPNKNNQTWLLEQARRQFDLGTAAPSNGINTEFKTLFRDFVSLSADDLMGVDPDEVKLGAKGIIPDPKLHEAVLNFLRRVKRSIISLTQSMSLFGTPGTRSRVIGWAEQIDVALETLFKVGNEHIGTDDPDDKHFVTVLHALNVIFARANNAEAVPRSQLKSHVVQANDGGRMLDHAIAVYQRIQDDSKLDREDPDYLRQLFYQEGYVFKPNGKAANVLKERANIVRDNWLPNWT